MGGKKVVPDFSPAASAAVGGLKSTTTFFCLLRAVHPAQAGRATVRLLCLAALSLTLLPAAARADAVTDWNAVFLRAVRNETTPPPLAARNLAILHVAIFDGVKGCTLEIEHCGGKSSVPSPVRNPANPEPNVARLSKVEIGLHSTLESRATAEAAATAAAHRIALHLYPGRKAEFDALRMKSLAAIEDTDAKTAAVTAGEKAAEAVLASRAADGATTTVPYIPSAEPGRWRRTPPNFRPPEMPHWRFVTPFAIPNAAQFRPPPPPALDCARYAEDLNEVKRLGGKDSKERTEEQKLAARFWSDFSYTVTPPGHWNEIARHVALERKLPLAENARLFALLNMAMADAAIVCWDAKYTYDSWRPVTAIHQADTDGNDATAADAAWEPLLPTPSHPEYPSGHSTFSGAASAVLAHFFGADEVKFTIGCDALPGVTRSYAGFRAAAEEIGMSRVYGGIHFPSANKEGLKAGRAIGEFVVARHLKNCGQ